MLLRRVLALNLCPKADLKNISEFAPVKALFDAGIDARWSPLTLASTFLVARGIRGREGVEALRSFCETESFVLDWQNDGFVERFVTFFEQAWVDAIRATRAVSALSHQEGRHAGLSGMHFVETLKYDGLRHNLLRDVAQRLASFFQDPAEVSAQSLMEFYKTLVAKPFCLITNTYDVHRNGCRVLRKAPKVVADAIKGKAAPMVKDNSYNSMDFLRCFYNIMRSCMQAPVVLFTEPLWTKMCKCQSASDVDYFELTMEQANDLIRENSFMNWTTLLVLLCEVRQAIDAKGLSHFLWTLDKLVVRNAELAPALEDVTDFLVQLGAKGKTCYCVRLYEQVDAWLISLGSNISTNEDDW